VKVAAFARAGKRCERCGFLLKPGNVIYNHRHPDYLGGLPTLDNCEVLCVGCDKGQTYNVDIPKIAKARRIRKREAGIRKPRSIRGWKKFDGTRVFAPADRRLKPDDGG
jgi:5-methylcytosine-specific restriction endonuclease McrA